MAVLLRRQGHDDELATCARNGSRPGKPFGVSLKELVTHESEEWSIEPVGLVKIGHREA